MGWGIKPLVLLPITGNGPLSSGDVAVWYQMPKSQAVTVCSGLCDTQSETAESRPLQAAPWHPRSPTSPSSSQNQQQARASPPTLLTPRPD